jgi:hypothetical protein
MTRWIRILWEGRGGGWGWGSHFKPGLADNTVG